MTTFFAVVAAWLIGISYSFKLDLNLVECGVLTLLCFGKRLLLGRWFSAVERFGMRLAHRRKLAIGLAFVAPIIIRVALLPRVPVPAPWIPDEFSHLLIADTLVHGRLANPMHPLWMHFETIHVLTRPVYASVYFPGLGIVMALGQLLGHPWIGVLLSSGAMCAALLWMLYGFFPARWALLGAILAVVRWGALSYWVNSYWGGTVAAFAGALVLGASARLRRRSTVPLSLILGTGLIGLAYTRPVEGLALAIPAVGALALHQARIKSRTQLLRTALPAAAVCALGLLALGVYFHAITRNPFTTPYRLNQAMYGWPLTLPWEHPKPPPEFHNFNMQLYYEYERCAQSQKTGLAGIELATVHLGAIWRFFLGPALTLPLFWFGRSWRSNTIRMPLLCLMVSLVVGAVIVAYPHYIAPATGCFLALSVQSIRALRLWRRKTNTTGVALSRAVVATCLIMLPVRAFVDSTTFPSDAPMMHVFSALGPEEGIFRANVLKKLTSMDGRHVVFVQYDRQAYIDNEWVANGADIDKEKVIWVNDMGPKRNQEVLNYYPDRRFWLVRADDAPQEILPYKPELSRVTARPVPVAACPGKWPEVHSKRRRQ